jgi:ABC-type multidrug transport system fused ATPase/permease subunit
MTEPEGHIYVDGIDAKSIGLHELRSKISIIPPGGSRFVLWQSAHKFGSL